mgnify:CR=1 FL=1
MRPAALALAVAALLELARANARDQPAPLSAWTIAQAIGSDPTYLAKVLTLLAAAGLVTSRSGPGGGFFIGRSPDRITLADVVMAIESPEELTGQSFAPLDQRTARRLATAITSARNARLRSLRRVNLLRLIEKQA